MDRLKHCRFIQTLGRVGRRADRIVSEIVGLPSVLAALSFSIAAMHAYILLVMGGYLQPSYPRFKDSTSLLTFLLYIMFVLMNVCKSCVDSIFIRDLKATIEEQDAIIKEQNTAIAHISIDNIQHEDIVALKNMIIAKERDFARRFGSDRNLGLNAPFNGEGGMQIDPAIQAHRDLVGIRLNHHEMKMKGFLKEHERQMKGHRNEIEVRVDEIRRELNGRLRRTP